MCSGWSTAKDRDGMEVVKMCGISLQVREKNERRGGEISTLKLPKNVGKSYIL